MAIIPILAFIILVATISTFIFAIGAYIMFKMREMRGKSGGKKEEPHLEVEVVGADGVATNNGVSADAANTHQNGNVDVVTAPRRTREKFRRYTIDGYTDAGKKAQDDVQW